ncbi:MAG: hypothetical protein Q8N84_01710 [bacterium]|nr:hypothetical protein [bacterium]
MSYKSLFAPAIEIMAEEIGQKILPRFMEIAKYSAIPPDLAEPFQQTVKAYLKALTPNTDVFSLQVGQMWVGICRQFIEKEMPSTNYCMGAVMYLAAVLSSKVLLQQMATQGTSIVESTKEHQEAVTTVGWYTFVDQSLKRCSPGDQGLKPAAVIVETYFRRIRREG